jgi:hypothetical protein
MAAKFQRGNFFYYSVMIINRNELWEKIINPAKDVATNLKWRLEMVSCCNSGSFKYFSILSFAFDLY